MATRRIDSIIDVPAVQAEYEKLLGFLGDLSATMDKVANQKIGAANQAQGIRATQEAVADLSQATAQLATQQEKLVSQAQTIVNTAKQELSTNAQLAAAVKQYSGSIEENIRLQISLTKQLQDNKSDLKELQQAYDSNKKSAAAFNQEQIALQKQQLELKSSISTLNSTLKQQTQENLTAETSYKNLNAQLVQLRTAYRNLSESERSSEGGQALKAQITQLDQALKSIDNEMGIHVRHVGNYTGALKTLESGLTEARADLERYTQAGQQNSQQAQQAQAEIDLFTQLLDQQRNGFASVTAEIRATERALATMVQAGMEETQMFKSLQQELAQAQRKLHDFKQDQALLRSDVPTLNALTTAAKGLAGMYALGAGTAALFADGNEKVEKELNKLVAVMTVLQGLQEVHELLERRGAIATIASNVVQGVKNFILTGSAKAQQDATAAQISNTAATEGDVAATEADIAAKEAQTAAIETTTVATTGATRAAIGLRIALLATGIGAILVLLPMLANAMDLFGKSMKERAKDAADLAEAQKALTDAIIKQVEVMNNADQAIKNFYQNQLALAQAAGRNQYEQLALKKQIAAAEREEAKATLDALQSQLGRESELLASYQLLEAKRQEALRINKKALEDGDATAANASKNLIDMWGKQADAAKASYDAVHKAHSDYYAAVQKDGQLELETNRLTNEERVKLNLATAKIAADARIQANQLILDNERSTLAQQLAANESNLEQQLAIIEAEKKARLADPGITKLGRIQAEKDAQAQADKARIDNLAQINKTDQDFWKKNFEAYVDLQKGRLQETIEINSQIAGDEGVSLENRLIAYQSYEKAQEELLDRELFYKLSTEALTDKQIEAAQAEHQAKLNALTRAGIEQRKKFQQETIETGDSRAQSELTANYNADVSALADALIRKRISQEKYNEEKKKLDEQNEIDQLRIEMETTRQLIAITAEGTKQRYDLEKKLEDENAKMAGLQAKRAEELADKRAKGVAKWVKYEQEGQHVVQSLVDDSFTRRLNLIQRQSEANTKAKDKEIADINASSLSAQDKAAKTILAEEQAKIFQDKLDKERRDTQLRQAKFDRDAQVLEIIGNTLVAASKAGWITPPAIEIEVEGAIQAALLAAKPLPRFEKGTEHSPEGWALTDEKGPELYRRPTGQIFMGNDRPTLRYLEAGTEIIPHERVDKFLHQQAARSDSSLIVMQTDPGTAREIRQLRHTMETQGQRLEKAYAKAQRPIYIFQQPDLKSRYVP